jgi:hypothetical protein
MLKNNKKDKIRNRRRSSSVDHPRTQEHWTLAQNTAGIDQIKDSRASATTTGTDVHESFGSDEFWNVLTGAPPDTKGGNNNVVSSVKMSRRNIGVPIQLSANYAGRNETPTMSIHSDNKKNTSDDTHSDNCSDTDKEQKKKRGFVFRRRFRTAKNTIRLAKPRRAKGATTYAADSNGSPSIASSENMNRTNVALNSMTISQQNQRSRHVEGDADSKSGRNSEATAAIDSDFDPMMMLLEVAEKLDPWGDGTSDEDSNSDTSISEAMEQEGVDEMSVPSTPQGEQAMPSLTDHALTQSSTPSSTQNQHCHRLGKLESLLDQKLPDVSHSFGHTNTGTNSSTTEIRLKVNPVGDTLSEEIIRGSNYNDRANNTVVSSSEDESRFELFDDTSHDCGEKTSKTRPSFATSTSRTSVADFSRLRPSLSETTISKVSALGTVESATHQSKTNTSSLRRDDAIERRKFPSDEIKIPRNLQIEQSFVVNEATVDKRTTDQKDSTTGDPRGVWKRVACWRSNRKGDDSIQAKRNIHTAHDFPTTRMISNGQSRVISGANADVVNGIMDVPQDQLAHAGPHSLYSYAYESAENMDVYYKEIGQRPRTSVSVRRLGEPPVARENTVVIQVEV